MAKKRLSVLENLLKSALRLDRGLSVKDRFWLWRSSLLSSQGSSQAGFILPTVTLLLLMLSLILGVLIFRTGNRTTEVIGDRQQRQVYNAATPAVERAKAKLEYLFTEESIPVLPSEDDIESSLLTNPIYTLSGERRVDVDGDGTLDNAWTFDYDSQGLRDDDVDNVTIVYSILSRASRGNVAIQSRDELKAANLVVRNGPINLTGGAGNPDCPQETRSPFQGWQRVTGAELRKAVQVHAVAIPGEQNPSQTRATLEFQQDKVANLGNKWGAWFRTDMEIFPGANFQWNGAMNTAGSYFVGGNFVNLYPISSQASCVYTKESSEMVMSLIDEDNKDDLNDGKTFQGQFVIGTLRDNNLAGSARLFPADPPGNNAATISRNNDNDSTSIGNNPIDLALEPVSVLTEGVNRRRDGAEPVTDAAARDLRDAAWDGRDWVTKNRLYNKYEPTPFVDDTYRADDRWGPKPVYQEDEDGELRIQPGVIVSDPATNEIPTSTQPNDSEDLLTRLNPLATNVTDEQGYGLDGYWERRARAQGVRLIVGQRLALGNAYGWQTEVDANGDGDVLDPGDIDYDNDGILDFDPLYPPPANPAGTGSMRARQHELMQWKTLRANPAAAQSTAIYHYLMNQGAYPIACLASASHPGTQETILASTRFEPIEEGAVPKVDFLTGQGTNGWEFAPYGYGADYEFDTFQPGAVTHAGLEAAHNDFQAAINNRNSPLRVALSNLANFSGDLAGAFPPVQDERSNGGANGGIGPVTHPYPIHTMWGDFSNLRRALDKLDRNAAVYSNNLDDAVRPGNALSLADQTTLQTASCTLGILAYSLDNAVGEDGQGADYRKIRGQRTRLVNTLRALTDGRRDNGEIEREPAGVGENLVVYQAVENLGDTPEEIYRGKAAPTGSTPANKAETGLLAFNPQPDRRALSIPVDVLAEALPEGERELALQLQNNEQLNRDRLMGFAAGGNTYPVQFNHNDILGQDLEELGIRPRRPEGEIALQCDFEGTNYFGLGRPRTRAREAEFLTLAFALCPRSAKYPSLYYLFPAENHDHVGTGTDFVQPVTEPYTSNRNATLNGAPFNLTLNGAPFDNAYGILTNRTNPVGGATPEEAFRVVGDLNGNGRADDDGSDGGGFAAIALRPKQRGSWALPAQAGSTDGPNTIVDAVTAPGTPTNTRISLLDKGIFDGREQMAVRVLDIDLDLLRRNTVTGSNETLPDGVNVAGADTDYWMPLPTVVDPEESPSRTGAAFYAFREDAVREDAIARPRSVSPNRETWLNAWLDYADDTGAPPAAYLMNATAFNTTREQDPPANPNNGLSPKAVDFYADPARRPHGFRLQRGADLRRAGQDLTDERGISFISDNSVYIQGNFNEHRASTAFNTVGENIQEFEGGDRLADNWNNFFDRTELDDRFARPEQDTWRASEIVADAVSILSDDFIDGWISESFVRNSSAAPAPGGRAESSFEAINQVRTTDLSWVRIDGRVHRLQGSTEDEAANEAVPIKLSQRGFPVYCSVAGNFQDASTAPLNIPEGGSCAAFGGVEREYGLQDPTQAFVPFSERRALVRVNGENFVNAIAVSGTIPSRVNQSNGGLHNFPRFIENWQRTPLRFGGSLFQLNFSNYNTGQFDQDSWEPGQVGRAGTGDVNESIPFYWTPQRLWGYDVALQYVGPSPVAQRFAGRANIRSEFYQELAIDDPYIVNLRCAAVEGNAADPTCPR